MRGGRPNRALRKARIFELAKGFFGKRKNCYSIAVRAVHKKLQYQYVSRRLKKRDMRKLWITRINIAAREHNIGYSYFAAVMAREDILLNRKVLSELSIHEPRSFQSIAELAKRRVEDGLLAAIM
ncbi:large ribosomal subunit protein bL20-like [Rhopilema esculentum]|uniref:large ribosomal subunit protein bL20-like n=1 Tax=Rhopilema esculentum TaxID=499914 RepID=UPI0031D54832|eukprot:gene5859-11182_t